MIFLMKLCFNELFNLLINTGLFSLYKINIRFQNKVFHLQPYLSKKYFKNVLIALSKILLNEAVTFNY